MLLRLPVIRATIAPSLDSYAQIVPITCLGIA
jgi:hypothetical protein